MLHALVGLPRSRRHERQGDDSFGMRQPHLKRGMASHAVTYDMRLRLAQSMQQAHDVRHLPLNRVSRRVVRDGGWRVPRCGIKKIPFGERQSRCENKKNGRDISLVRDIVSDRQGHGRDKL